MLHKKPPVVDSSGDDLPPVLDSTPISSTIGGAPEPPKRLPPVLKVLKRSSSGDGGDENTGPTLGDQIAAGPTRKKVNTEKGPEQQPFIGFEVEASGAIMKFVNGKPVPAPRRAKVLSTAFWDMTIDDPKGKSQQCFHPRDHLADCNQLLSNTVAQLTGADATFGVTVPKGQFENFAA